MWWWVNMVGEFKGVYARCGEARGGTAHRDGADGEGGAGIAFLVD